MKEYILSILGVILIGSLIDIVIPSGKLNNFIKSMFAIFVLAVVVSPISRIIKSGEHYLLNSNIQSTSGSIIYDKMIESKEKYISSMLTNNGFKNIDIELHFTIQNDELNINSCNVFTKNMVIDLDKQHINKYDYIRGIIKNCVMLDDEEIVFYE